MRRAGGEAGSTSLTEAENGKNERTNPLGVAAASHDSDFFVGGCSNSLTYGAP